MYEPDIEALRAALGQRLDTLLERVVLQVQQGVALLAVVVGDVKLVVEGGGGVITAAQAAAPRLMRRR